MISQLLIISAPLKSKFFKFHIYCDSKQAN